MAFGQELKDFVAGFQSGYQLVKSPDEKKREAAEEARAQGRYDREGVWHKEDMDWKKEGRAYDQSQDAKTWDWKADDRKYNRAWDADERRFNRYRQGQQDEAATRAEKREDERIQIERQRVKNEAMKKAIAEGDAPPVDEFGNAIEGYDTPAPYEEGEDKVEGGINRDQLKDDLKQEVSNKGWREPERPQEIAAQLVSDLTNDVGMSREAAVGVVGQLAHESGGFRSLQEINPMVNGSRGGWGYAQWTGPRRRQFESFAKQYGLDPRSYAANYEFLRYELLNTPEGNVLKGLRQMDDSRQAGRYFTNKFLRPGIPGYQSRDKWTDRVASLYSSNGGMIRGYDRGGFVEGLASGFNTAKQFTGGDRATAIPEEGMPVDTSDGSGAFAEGQGSAFKLFPDAPFRQRMEAGENFRLFPDAPFWDRDKTTAVPVQMAQGSSAFEVNAPFTKYASGGYVTAVPEDEEEQARMAEQELINQQIEQGDQLAPEEPTPAVIPVEQKALPETEEEVTSQSNPEETPPADETGSGFDDYDSGRKAAREAWKKSEADFNKENPPGALEDPELEKRYEQHKLGYGAAPHQMMKQVFDKIDPKRQMTPSERNVKAMGYVYRFYEERGDTEKAKEAAKSMLQYYRQNYNKFSSIAEAARQEGDLDTATKAFVAAYANVPNGKDLDIAPNDDGSVTVTVTDQKTGKVITKQLANLEQLAARAANMNPNDFDNMLRAAADVKPTDVKETSAKPGSEEGANVKTNMNDAYSSRFATEDSEDEEGNITTANPDAAFMNTAKEKTLKSAVKHLMGVEGNNMDEGEGMDFLDPTSPEPFGKKTVEGNKDFYDVRRNGITKRMRVDQYNKIVSDWKKIQVQKAKNAETAEAKAKQDAADAADPNKQTDVLGAASRFLTPDEVKPQVNETDRRRQMFEQNAAQPDTAIDTGDVLTTAGDILGGGAKRPLPGREPEPAVAIPEEERTGLIDQLFTPGKPASDIVKTVTGVSADRMTKQRDQLQLVLERMRGNPEYKNVIPKREAQLRELNAQITETLRSEIAALERDAAQATGESDTTDYQSEIARRREALKLHEKRLLAAR